MTKRERREQRAQRALGVRRARREQLELESEPEPPQSEWDYNKEICDRYPNTPYVVGLAAVGAARRAQTKLDQAASYAHARATRTHDIDRAVDWFTRLFS